MALGERHAPLRSGRAATDCARTGGPAAAMRRRRGILSEGTTRGGCGLFGPEIIRATMSRERTYGTGDAARLWQYHSRSDYHSKVAALALAIDLLHESPELRDGVERGEIGFEVNPKMRDGTDREKTLDLRFARVDDARPLRQPRTLLRLAEQYELVLGDECLEVLATLPTVWEARAKEQLIVFENKACMTAHQKAAPRLRNELEGAVKAINATKPRAVAAGLVMVNAATEFYSPVWKANGWVATAAEREATVHRQPQDAFGAAQKLKNIPRRRTVEEEGYDALAIVVVSARNDGTAWRLVDDPAAGAPESTSIWNYVAVVQRVAELYRERFA
ncbi:MAG: hypothetical protein H5T80_09215 [Dietzia sp.]|nr:hypothetical protein [Dietzia sp.]